MRDFSDEEKKIREEIRAIYNSGDCGRALEISKDFMAKFPGSLIAKYSYAVMSGDYAHDPKHSEQEKERLLQIAKQGTLELFNNPEVSAYPPKFQKSVKNEYYWFHEMPEEQYKLGIEEIKTEPSGGHYSACVGASMVALKMISQDKIREGEDWARKSLFHFSEFEKLSPFWYNINYFGAQSEACLGNYEKALEVFKGMYQKQNSEIKIEEVNSFQAQIQKIREYRKENKPSI